MAPVAPHFDDVYAALKRSARAALRRAGGAELRPTELVHEAWTRLEKHTFEGPTHYRAVAAMAMRQILLDQARSRMAQKRQEPAHITLDPGLPTADLVALNLALEELEALDPRGYQVAVLRYLGGLTAEETAEHLGVSRRTVQSVWRLTRVWLLDRLTE